MFGSKDPNRFPLSLAEDEWVAEELPSPGSDEEFLEVAEELLREVETMAAEKMQSPWITVNQSASGVKCMEKGGIPQLEGTPLTMLKAEGLIEGLSPMDILELTLELDVSKRKTTDPDLVSLRLVKEVAPTVQVTISEIATPFPVTNREFCDLRTWRVEEGGARVIYGSKSVHVAARRNPDLVRGKAFNGVVLQSDGDNATHMCFLGYVDPKGYVPLSLIAAFKGRITEKYDIYRKVAQGATVTPRRRSHQRSKSSIPSQSPSELLRDVVEQNAEEAPPKRGHRRSYSGARSLRPSARRSLEEYEEKKKKKAKSPRKRFHRRGQSITGRLSLQGEEVKSLSRSSDRVTRVSPRATSAKPSTSAINSTNRVSPQVPIPSPAAAPEKSDIEMLRLAVESMQRQQESNQTLNSRLVMMLMALLVFSLALHFVR